MWSGADAVYRPGIGCLPKNTVVYRSPEFPESAD